MATISSSIRLMDNMTPAISSMMRGMNSMIAGFESMERASKSAVDTKSMAAAKAEMSRAATAVNQFEKELKQATDQQEKFNSSTKNNSSSMSGLAGIAKTAATAMAAVFAVDKIVDFGKSAIESAGSAKAMESQFTQTFAELEPAAQSAVNEMAGDFGMVPNRLKPAMSQMTSMFKGLGLDTSGAMSEATKAVTISADAAAFYDKSFSDANSALTSFVKGNYEGGEAIGLFANDTQMATYAVSKGLVEATKDWAGLDEATKQATRLTYAQNMQKLAGATGQAARESDGLENQVGNIKQAWSDFLAVVGKPVLGSTINILKDITVGLQSAGRQVDFFIDGFKGIGDPAALSGLDSVCYTVGTEFSIASETFKTNIDQITEKIKERSPEMIASMDNAKTSWVIFYERLVADNEVLQGIDWQSGLVAAMDAEIEKVSALITLFTTVGTILTDVQKMKEAFWQGGDAFKEAAIQFDQDLIKMSENIAKASAGAPDPNTMLASAMEANRGSLDAAAANMVSSVTTPLTELSTNASAAGNTIGLGVGSSIAAGATNSLQVGFAELPVFGQQAGADAMAQMDSAIQNGTPAVAASADATRLAIQQKLDPLGAFGRTTGQQTGDGFIQGLKEREGAIASGGDAAASTLKTSFKSALGINSPSTVFRDFGYYAIDGLIQGLSSTELLAFAEGIVADIKEAFSNNKFNLQTGIEFLGSGAAEFFKSIGIGGASLGQLVTPLSGGVTSGFGYRDPFMTDSGQMSSDWHAGIDIGAPYGAPVGAAGAGTVTMAGWNGGYGNTVMIDHGNGLSSMYAHLSEILVSVGQLVSALQTIGLVGSTGNSTGPHLHFGLFQDGVAIDPSALWGYANGTTFATPGLHLVGEHGPEIVNMAGGEKVLNAKKSKALIENAGSKKSVGSGKVFSPVINLTMGDTVVNNELDVDAIRKKLGKMLVDEMTVSAQGLYEAV